MSQAVAVNSVSEKSSPMRISKKVEQNYSDVNSEKEHSYDESYTKQSETHSTSRNTSSVSSGRDLLSTRGSNWDDEWHSNLLGCCSEPILWQLARKVYENIRREASCLRIQRDFRMHILQGKLIKNCALLLFLFRLACVEWLHMMSFASEGRLLFMESFHCCILLAFISRNSKNFFYTSF